VHRARMKATPTPPGQAQAHGRARDAPWLKPCCVQCGLAASERKTATTKAQRSFSWLQSRGEPPSWPAKKHVRRRRFYAHRHYHMLKDGTIHQDLGSGEFSTSVRRKSREAVLVNQIAKLGFESHLDKPIAKAAC